MIERSIREADEITRQIAFMLNEKLFKNSALWDDMQHLPFTPESANGKHIRVCGFYGSALVAVVTIASPQGWAYEIQTAAIANDEEHELLEKEIKLKGFNLKLVRRNEETVIQFLCSWGAVTTVNHTKRFCNSLGMSILAQLISRTYPKKCLA